MSSLLILAKPINGLVFEITRIILIAQINRCIVLVNTSDSF